MVEKFCCILAVSLGSVFSSQIWSISIVADFWLACRVVNGFLRCIMDGKYPNNVENLDMADGFLCFRFWVKLLSSIARVNPIRDTSRAVILRYKGIVIWGTVIGGILLEMINPAKILPASKRVMGFINRGLFSLIKTREGNRGFPSSTKKIIRVL